MNTVLQTILTTSFHGSIVILAVLLLRLVLSLEYEKITFARRDFIRYYYTPELRSTEK